MFEKFRPINDFVLVKILERENKTTGGIFIPSEAQEKNQMGVVICPGKSLQLFVGDKVCYKKYMGSTLDDTYLVLKEEEILGVMSHE